MKSLLAVLAAVLLSPAVAAQTSPDDCECLWAGSFSEVARSADLVILGEVVSSKGNAVDFTPLERFSGDFWRDTARVWMRTGNYCRPAAEQFAPGSRWILALEEITEAPEDGFNPHTPNQSYGRPHDYILSACGGYWLSVRGETAVGNLLPGMARWDHEPDMTPVLVDLVAAFLDQRASIDDLRDASEEDPELKALMLDTRSFLRGQDGLLDSEATQAEKPAEPPP